MLRYSDHLSSFYIFESRRFLSEPLLAVCLTVYFPPVLDSSTPTYKDPFLHPHSNH